MFRQPIMFTQCRITKANGGLAIHSPYNPAFVAALKSTIPSTDRKWDANNKVWIVSPFYGLKVQELIGDWYNEDVTLPDLHSAPTGDEIKILDVRYLGAAKAREDGTETAYAWVGGEWAAIFPKAVLLQWFGQTQRPDEAQTLYAVLGVSQDADTATLKTAWRRMARTWHPDVSKEPGSREQFQAIQEAYEVLGDEVKRAKYNAGLAFEAMSKAHSQHQKDVSNFVASITVDWRAPLRCGLVLAKGQNRLGRFIVSEILQWADIANTKGEILVTSWAAGDDTFTESWVVP